MCGFKFNFHKHRKKPNLNFYFYLLLIRHAYSYYNIFSTPAVMTNLTNCDCLYIPDILKFKRYPPIDTQKLLLSLIAIIINFNCTYVGL